MANSQNKTGRRLLDGPIVLATLMCGGYYGWLAFYGVPDSLLHKYTTEHATEYVIVAALCWAVADLLLRALSFPRELRAIKQSWLPEREEREPAERTSEHYLHLQSLPAWMQHSRLGKRLEQALVYVHQKQSADGFDDHLRDLSERDALQTHTNYAVPRFVVWVAPVLGFLGTVVHFGTALGSLSWEKIDTGLQIVFTGMGTAFDTTTMALVCSVSIMFGMFLVERLEQGIVQEVDQLAERELTNRFAVEDANIAPFLSVVEASSRATLATIDEASNRQVQAWTQVLSDWRRQQDQWQHDQREAWSATIKSQQQRDETNDVRREERLRKLLESFASERTQQQEKMQLTVSQIAGLQNNLGRLTETLAGVLAGEGQLLSLQKSLADNLRLLQQTQHFDQAVNGLTAAIHLFTARQQGPALPTTRAA